MHVLRDNDEDLTYEDEDDEDTSMSSEGDAIECSNDFFGYDLDEMRAEQDNEESGAAPDEPLPEGDACQVETKASDPPQAMQCIIVYANDQGRTRCLETCCTHSVSLLAHARFEVDSDVAIEAMRNDKPHKMTVCQSHYMELRNDLRRCGAEFEGAVTVEKRLCRVCRTFRYFVGSSRGARYRTPGTSSSTQLTELRSPLVEVPAEKGQAGRSFIFVCVACVEKHMKTTKTARGKAAKKRQPVPTTSSFDNALDAAVQAASQQRKRTASSLSLPRPRRKVHGWQIWRVVSTRTKSRCA